MMTRVPLSSHRSANQRAAPDDLSASCQWLYYVYEGSRAEVASHTADWISPAALPDWISPAALPDWYSKLYLRCPPPQQINRTVNQYFLIW